MPFLPKKILAATDFSAGSADAVDIACDLSKTYGAPLTLLHVVPPATYLDYFAAANPQSAAALGYQTAVRDAVRKSWRDEEGRLRARGVTVEFATREGPPALEIAAFAGAGGFDLVVIGTHGRTGLKHVLLGSVAGGGVRHCQVPVLTVQQVAPIPTDVSPQPAQRR